MVVILSEVALLGKSFFHANEVALTMRIGSCVDFRKIGKQTIRCDFFADCFARKCFSDLTAAKLFADALRKKDTSFDECVVEVGLGDFHDFIFYDFGFGCKDYSATRAFIFSRTFLIARSKTVV